MTSSLPRKCSTTELGGHRLPSGRPDSNRRRSAWKADALPTELLPRTCWSLGNSRECVSKSVESWRVMDSNHRRHSRQIYSLLPLATRATLRTCLRFVTSRGLSGDAYDDELTRGLEPLTTCLQNRCSAIELRQPSRRGNPPPPDRRLAATGREKGAKITSRTRLAQARPRPSGNRRPW